MTKSTQKECQYTFVFEHKDSSLKNVIRANNKQDAICKLQSILGDNIVTNIRENFYITVLETKYIHVNIDIKR